ncbi:MAG: histidine kinase [Chromatiales bacterium 21-64-14]|nr:MAG: histidine kinase [Chromatiales bacterium 21-64-14]HQU17270.1 FIST N-terminal domain-containing protein [Gammaproteobacteria bacterium]
MGSFSFAHSAAGQWQEAAEHCLAALGTPPPGASLGFLYATDELAPHLDALLERVRERTGVPHWVGTVGVGICAGSQEYYEQPALALMVTDLPGDSFRVFPPLREGIEELDDGLDAWRQASGSHVALVHGDPRNPAVPDLIEALAGRAAGGFLVGGLSSSRAHYAQIADGVVDGGLSGVMFARDVAVLTGLTQGCTLIGSKHVVTRCQRNVAVELDGRPALEVFYEEIGEVLARDLNRIAGYIFVALPVPGSDTGDYLVRNLVGIDPAKGLLAVGDMLHTDDTLQFCRRDGASAHTDLVRMLRDLKRRAPDRAPRGGVYFSCLGRGRSMFGADSAELRTIQRELGEFPLVGFFANGEISHDRLYGYTGVLVLFA